MNENGTTVTQAPPAEPNGTGLSARELAQQTPEHVEDNIDQQLKAEMDAELACVASDTTRKHEFRLRPFTHPRTKRQRIYATGGLVSDADRLFIEPNESDPPNIVYQASEFEARRSPAHIVDDLHEFINDALGLADSDTATFSAIWELAIQLEQNDKMIRQSIKDDAAKVEAAATSS